MKRIERVLPHAAILIGNMYLVFFLIDRVNPAMNFIDNALTKGLLLVLCVVALLNAVSLLRSAARRRSARRGGRPAPTPARRAPSAYRAPSSGAPYPAARRAAPRREGGYR